MEILFARFSHLTEDIFHQLDNQSLVKCRLVGKNWQDYIDNQCQKLLQIRIITININKYQKIGHSWRRVFHTANTQTIIDLGESIGKFYKSAFEGYRYYIERLSLKYQPEYPNYTKVCFSK